MGAEQLIGFGDMLVDRTLAPESVRAALSRVLCVSLDEVRVSERIEEILLPPECDVFCQIRFIEGGDFHTHLSPHEALSKGLPAVPLVANLCRDLKCRCLIGDETLDPFAFYLIDETGECRHVDIDPDREAETGEFVVVESDRG